MDQDIFFKWDKSLIENKVWASLPLSAKAVFPVIAVHCNKQGESWPSEKIIAELSGYTEKTVRKGIQGLVKAKFADFTVRKAKRNCGKWLMNHYFVSLPVPEKKGYFPFHKSLITRGKWSQLKHTAQALYPAMRCFGYNDGYGRKYRHRDYCGRDKKFLAEHAGISLKSAISALENLEAAELIVSVPKHSAWRIFIL